jgi:hypothetical protein
LWIGDEQRRTHSCKKCEESFQVYSDLADLGCAAQTIIQGISDQEKELYLELGVEIDKCRANLVDWRSHIVRKMVESKFSRKRLRSLKKDEALVISDF